MMSPKHGGQVRKMVLVPASTDSGKSSVNTNSLVATTEQPVQHSNTSSDAWERHIINLDESMEKILRDKTLSDDEKLNKYLHLLRSVLLFKAKINLQQPEPIPVHIVKVDSEEQPISSSEEVASTEQQVRVEPESIAKHGQFKIPFAKTNIIKLIAPNIRAKAKLVLDGLTRSKNFAWNTSTGEMRMDDANLPPDADLRDLVLFKVRADLGEGLLAGDPPPHFNRFNQFLEREDIKSVRSTRTRGVPISRQLISAAAAVARDPLQNLGPTRRRVRRIGARQTASGGLKHFDWKNIKYLNY
jgi:hypothetical protein